MVHAMIQVGGFLTLALVAAFFIQAFEVLKRVVTPNRFLALAIITSVFQVLTIWILNNGGYDVLRANPKGEVLITDMKVSTVLSLICAFLAALHVAGYDMILSFPEIIRRIKKL